MSDINHTRDCILPSDGKAEGLVKASELFALAAERDALLAEIERLRAALRDIADGLGETDLAEVGRYAKHIARAALKEDGDD